MKKIEDPAAREREECAALLERIAETLRGHACPPYEACLRCERVRTYEDAAAHIRDRGAA